MLELGIRGIRLAFHPDNFRPLYFFILLVIKPSVVVFGSHNLVRVAGNNGAGGKKE